MHSCILYSCSKTNAEWNIAEWWLELICKVWKLIGYVLGDNLIVRHKQIQSPNSQSKSSSRYIQERQYLAIPLYFPSTVISCSVLVDSLEEGFHVLYLHLDSHHVDPSKYNQHELLNYCNSFLKSWYMLQLQKMCPLFRHWENNKKTSCMCLSYPTYIFYDLGY